MSLLDKSYHHFIHLIFNHIIILIIYSFFFIYSFSFFHLFIHLHFPQQENNKNNRPCEHFSSIERLLQILATTDLGSVLLALASLDSRSSVPLELPLRLPPPPLALRSSGGMSSVRSFHARRKWRQPEATTTKSSWIPRRLITSSSKS